MKETGKMIWKAIVKFSYQYLSKTWGACGRAEKIYEGE